MGSMGLSSPSSMRRRNSISSVIPTTLDLISSANSFNPPRSQSLGFPTVDFELSSFNRLPSSPPPSYTSLKDLLPSSPGIQSPTAATQSCHEISIRNHLVKHAAWAYLQPMASSPCSSSSSSAAHRFLRRIWFSFSGSGLFGFFRHRLLPTIRCAFSRLIGVLSLGIGR